MVGTEFALNLSDLGMNFGFPYGTLTLQGVNSKHRARSKQALKTAGYGSRKNVIEKLDYIYIYSASKAPKQKY